MMRSSLRLVLSLSASAALAASAAAAYDGVWVSGSSSSAAGAEALELIDKARRSLGEGPELEIEYQTMPMLYKGSEDGILEGPTWGCYWTQNSCAHRTDAALHACRLPFCSVSGLTSGEFSIRAFCIIAPLAFLYSTCNMPFRPSIFFTKPSHHVAACFEYTLTGSSNV